MMSKRFVEFFRKNMVENWKMNLKITGVILVMSIVMKISYSINSSSSNQSLISFSAASVESEA